MLGDRYEEITENASQRDKRRDVWRRTKEHGGVRDSNMSLMEGPERDDREEGKVIF